MVMQNNMKKHLKQINPTFRCIIKAHFLAATKKKNLKNRCKPHCYKPTINLSSHKLSNEHKNDKRNDDTYSLSLSKERPFDSSIEEDTFRQDKNHIYLIKQILHKVH